jgi:hypothetical protein
MGEIASKAFIVIESIITDKSHFHDGWDDETVVFDGREYVIRVDMNACVCGKNLLEGTASKAEER